VPALLRAGKLLVRYLKVFVGKGGEKNKNADDNISGGKDEGTRNNEGGKGGRLVIGDLSSSRGGLSYFWA